MKPKPLTNTSRKTATKSCPGCGVQIPCACKTCACGHVFKSRTESSSEEASSERLRRTERTKRAPPDFYHIQIESARLKRAYAASLSAAKNLEVSQPRRTMVSRDALPRRRGPRAPGLAVVKPPPDINNESSNSSMNDSSIRSDVDLHETLPSEKKKQFAILLNELNRKNRGLNFRPV